MSFRIAFGPSTSIRGSISAIVAMMCLAAPSVAAQMWGPHAEYDRLYERLARSAFVIQGTVTGVDSIMSAGLKKLA